MSSNEASASERQWRTRLVAIVLAGLGIRVVFVWFGSRHDGPVGDQLFYSAQAIANARGDWFEQPFSSGLPAADHPPLTSLIITPITYLLEFTGSVVTVQRLFMALLGTLSIVVMAQLVRSIGGIRSGLIAGATTAAYVNIWVNDGLIMAESPTFLIVALLTGAVFGMCASSTPARCAAAGTLLGFAALARPELIALVPLTAGIFVVHSRSRLQIGRIAGRVAVLVGVSAAVVAPWIVWNNMRFDAPVLLSTNDGLTLAGANCDSTYFDDVGGWDIWCAYETDVPDGFDAAQASALMRKNGLEYWSENLDRYPAVAAARLARVFSVGYVGAAAESATAEGRPVWLSHIGAVQYWILVPLAAVGARRRATRLQLVVLTATLPIVIAVALVANAYVRFRVPAEVGLVVLASLGVDSAWPRVERMLLSVLRPAST